MQRELKILLSTAALFLLAGGLFGPVYAVFVKEIGGDLLTAGTAYAVFSISAGILIFFISKWEDHVKHQEKLIIAGYVLSCIGYFGLLLIREPWHLFIVQIVFGVGEAIGTPAYDGLYSKHLDKGRFVSEWGLWESMQWIVTAVAAAAGGFIANTYGFKPLFTVMLIASIIGLSVSLSLLVKKKRRSR